MPGASDADALALAATELVGEALQVLLAEPDQGDQLPDAVIQPPPAGALVHHDRLGQDGPHGLARVERGVGVLEDHLHLGSLLPQLRAD